MADEEEATEWPVDKTIFDAWINAARRRSPPRDSGRADFASRNAGGISSNSPQAEQVPQSRVFMDGERRESRFEGPLARIIHDAPPVGSCGDTKNGLKRI